MKSVPNRIVVFLLLFVFLQTSVFAAPKPPPPKTPPPPPGLPLDEWVVFLLGVSLIYGFYKYMNFSKKEKVSK